MGRFIDITGKRFGRLTVVGLLQKGKDLATIFECVCDCGGTAQAQSYSLRNGYTRSCGCLVKETASRVLGDFRRNNPSSSNTRKYNVNHNYFDTIDTEEKAYWLGFISADGNVCIKGENSVVVTINLKPSDYQHLQKFAHSLDCESPVRKSTNACSIAINSKKMGDDLIKLGVNPRKSLSLKTCKSVPPHLQRHYWRGLIDGDGCLHVRKDGYFSVELTGTKDICEGFKSWVSYNGIKSRASVKKRGNIFCIRYDGTDLVKNVSNLMYQDSRVFLNRKYETYQEVLK